MKVALDAQLTVGTATGIGEYVRGLAAALRGRVELIELCEPALDPWRFDRRVLWDQLLMPMRARACGAQLLHCAAGTVPRFARIPIVVTVHDLAWHEAQAHAPAYARYYFGPFSFGGYRSARRVLADSNFSRNELLRLLDLDPARVEVVYPGVAADFCGIPRGGGDGRTILAVGTIEPRKNLAVLIRALPRLENARLVAVGPMTPYARECAALAQRLNVADRVLMPGYIARSELLALYASCAVAAVPSRYEGFGYAAAQALCAGVPCVVSDRSSLPEVVDGKARIVDADDADAWAAALGEVLAGADDARAAQVRVDAIGRFSWESSARRVANVYASSING